jgi:hypothetical protein
VADAVGRAAVAALGGLDDGESGRRSTAGSGWSSSWRPRGRRDGRGVRAEGLAASVVGEVVEREGDLGPAYLEGPLEVDP